MLQNFPGHQRAGISLQMATEIDQSTLILELFITFGWFSFSNEKWFRTLLLRLRFKIPACSSLMLVCKESASSFIWRFWGQTSSGKKSGFYANDVTLWRYLPSNEPACDIDITPSSVFQYRRTFLLRSLPILFSSCYVFYSFAVKHMLGSTWYRYIVISILFLMFSQNQWKQSTGASIKNEGPIHTERKRIRQQISSPYRMSMLHWNYQEHTDWGCSFRVRFQLA